MYAEKLLRLASKLDNLKQYKLADIFQKLAQDMSIPFYRYPTQQRNDYKNRIPMNKNFKGDSQPKIDNRFGQDANIYLQQMVIDPLLFDHAQSKIMLDTIINDPDYKMDQSSFVDMINVYRDHYDQINENKNDIKTLSKIEPELHKHLNNILSKT
jgi:hypothetical protein